MDPLQQALDLLDKSAAIISALLEECKSSASKTKEDDKEDLSKKAEILAAKTGLPFEQTHDMLKIASSSGIELDKFEKIAENFRSNGNTSFQFGKPSVDTDFSLAKTARERAEFELSEIEI